MIAGRGARTTRPHHHLVRAGGTRRLHKPPPSTEQGKAFFMSRFTITKSESPPESDHGGYWTLTGRGLGRRGWQGYSRDSGFVMGG